MWSYEKRLQHPVCITERNPRLAQVIMSQFGGPDGELAASMRYLSQRYAIHTLGLWPQSAGGVPFTSTFFQSKGDPITDLVEDMAAEQKSRRTYDNILRLVHEHEVCDPIMILREKSFIS